MKYVALHLLIHRLSSNSNIVHLKNAENNAFPLSGLFMVYYYYHHVFFFATACQLFTIPFISYYILRFSFIFIHAGNGGHCRQRRLICRHNITINICCLCRHRRRHDAASFDHISMPNDVEIHSRTEKRVYSMSIMYNESAPIDSRKVTILITINRAATKK